MTLKERYKEICDEYPIPLFSQYWWMDAVCQKWDVFIYEENGRVLGTMPYAISKKLGFQYILQPQLTQTNGVWINYPEHQITQEKYSLEEKICSYFINELKRLKLSFFQQSFHHSFTNWLPFYWMSFRQTTRYTYVISEINDIEVVEKRFSGYKRKHLKKAKNLKIINDVSASQFYDHHCKTLKAKGEKIVYSRHLFQNIYNSAIIRNQGKVIAIGDDNGDIYAALFIVWDKQSAYNLISTIDPNHKKSGASTRVVLEAIRFVSDKAKCFDFEGSMIKEVENSFREFGAKQKPYFQIEKYYSVLFRCLFRLKRFFH